MLNVIEIKLGNQPKNLTMRKRKGRKYIEEEVEAEEAEEPSISMTKQHRDIMYSLE